MEKFKSLKQLTELELGIILNVKHHRILRKISKEELSRLLGKADSFVGKVESLKDPDKYNIRNLQKLTIIFKLKSVRDLIPKEIPKYLDIEVIYEMVPMTKLDGSPSKKLEQKIVEIRAIKEVKEKE